MKPRTLRSRVLWLFMTLALAPFLAASLIQYRQAKDEGDWASTAVANVVASEVAEEAERVYREASADARAFALEAQSGTAVASWTPRFPHSVLRIEVWDGLGSSRAVWSTGRQTLVEICGDIGESPAFTFDVAIPAADGRGGQWKATVSADPSVAAMIDPVPTLAGDQASIKVSDGVRGFVSSAGCQLPATAPSAIAERAAGLDDGVLPSVFILSSIPWVVETSVSRAATGNAGGTAAWFLAVAALTAAVATLLFALLLSGVTRSLEDLGKAAERIGQGDFSPWLPPPGDDEAGRLSFAIGHMVDQIREMMGKVKRTGQMAAIGEMASYVAHEIRNPLNSLRLNLQSVQRSADLGTLDSDDMESLEICLGEVSRLDRVVSGVLRLSRPPTSEISLTSLHGVIRDAAGLLSDELDGRQIDLRLDLAATEDWIRADAQQIEAAIINLILNAAEAIASEGEIQVRTRTFPAGQHQMVELVLSDSGPGVPAELRARIFEPFFTSKPGGSGLGLAVVMRTVEEHGGTMRLDEPSGLGQGATFRITFLTMPAVEEIDVPPRRWHLVGLENGRAGRRGIPVSELREATTAAGEGP